MSFDVGSVQLRELSVRITKGTTPTKGEGFVACGVNYIKSESITADGSIDVSKFAFIDAETHDKLARSKLCAGNVLFSMAGVYLGKTAVVLPEHLPANTNQAVGIVSLDESKADPYFIHYSLQSPACRAWVLRSAAQSAQPNFNLQEIGDLKIPAFPIARQKEIASVLRALDDRITLLRETNATLEAIAQALFKSWFVDFDPVHAKQQGRAPEGMDEATAALFPESFEESELGLVPKGWRVSTLGDCTSYLNRGISPKYVESGGIVVVNQKCIRDFAVDLSKARRHDPAQRKIDGRELCVGDVLVNSTGVGTLGRVAQVLTLDEMAIVDSHVTVVRADTRLGWNYVGLALMRKQPEIEGLGEGTTGQTELSRGKLASIQMLVPSRSILDQFDEITVPLRNRFAANHAKAQTLATLRDTLLPRLISGQLRLPEAEALIEEIA